MISKKQQKFDRIIENVLERIAEHKSVQVGSQDAALIVLTRIEELLNEQNELLRAIVQTGPEKGAPVVKPPPPVEKKKRFRLFG